MKDMEVGPDSDYAHIPGDERCKRIVDRLLAAKVVASATNVPEERKAYGLELTQQDVDWLRNHPVASTLFEEDGSFMEFHFTIGSRTHLKLPF